MLSTAWRGAAGYLGAIWDIRYFWLCLVAAELRRRYRRSILGVGWSLLQPVTMTLVLALVYRRLFNISVWDFAPMLLTGLSFWNLLTHTVIHGCSSLIMAEPYIRQQPLPLAIFPLRSAITIGFHFVVSLGAALAFVVVSKAIPHPLALLTLIPTLLLLFFFAWGLALLAGFANVYFPDTQHLSEVSLQMLMFLTPVMYPPSLLKQNGLEFLLHYNPLAVLLNLIRAPLIYGQVPALGDFGIAALFVSLVVAVAVWTVSQLEHRLIFAL